jgi:hypothetical protein
MYFSNERAAEMLSVVRMIVARDEPDSKKLRDLWMSLHFMHSFDLARTLVSMLGPMVYSGPFKGMKLPETVLAGAFGPVLLGAYETELHDTIEDITTRPYTTILNIGSGYGYYSVGFAMRMPKVKIHGFDTSENERKRCADMVALNGVGDRVQNDGLFDGARFADYAAEKTLVFMDIEGGELDLLDPVRYPALQKMDVVVELHDVFNPEITKIITGRFAPTHDVTVIPNKANLFDFRKILPDSYVCPLDEGLATWEGRAGPTPWAVMRPKSSAKPAAGRGARRGKS